jgi:hypothetical protein
LPVSAAVLFQLRKANPGDEAKYNQTAHGNQRAENRRVAVIVGE